MQISSKSSLLPGCKTKSRVVKNAFGTREDFKIYCFEPAFEKRKIIRRQLALMDMEYSENMPDIKVRD